jgi:hypothetical protein
LAAPMKASTSSAAVVKAQTKRMTFSPPRS